jgi:hypothetical protein
LIHVHHERKRIFVEEIVVVVVAVHSVKNVVVKILIVIKHV